MRSRPDVELRMSRTVHPGDVVLVELVLRSRARTPVDSIELHLEGMQIARVEERVLVPPHFLSLVARLAGETTLPEGEQRYRASFPLPADAPCSYLGTRAEIRYGITLSIAIPWWLDVQESYEVLVTPRPVTRPPRSPAAGTTARGDSPFIEVSLDDQVFAPGDEISGAVALGNVQGRGVRGMEISLVGVERLLSGGPAASNRATEAHRFTAFRRADSRDEGRELPFRFRIPRSVAPSFDAGWVALVWGLEVRVELARADGVVHTTPLVLGVFDRPPGLGAIRRQIGSGRWRAVWGAVGARHGLSLDPLELRLSGALSGCAASVWIDAGSSSSGALVGELRWPSWGLDLEVGVKRFLLALASEDDEGFGRRYRVRGRDPGQVRAVVAGPLRRALLAFDDVRLDDEHVSVRSRTPGHDQPWLGAFLEHLAALAAEITAASARIPPPTPMAGMRPAWERFAAEVHGRFEVGRMRIRDAQLDGATFHIDTCFERGPYPERSEVTLVLDPPLDAALDPDDPEQLRAASPGAREALKRLRARTHALRIAPHAIVITVPAPLEDPATLRDLLGAQLHLSALLRGRRVARPYR
ncbi:hypothetical protein [Sorangium cellulosum]|uniref:Arrestin-like N-terminal domain-containing protein n=1 Tax=Sorangium cellulosum So0157-2 TaxID=1254432 RepID=S4XWT2_SORCE|nr:hypothetical protein [Sorangium cellulosum]AGP35038.1 hypothetical protein SCE1572_11270 [Sorangium cellulosum So0157-2]